MKGIKMPPVSERVRNAVIDLFNYSKIYEIFYDKALRAGITVEIDFDFQQG